VKILGSEHKADRTSEAAVVGALAISDANEGRAPGEAYYPPGSSNHARELAGWPRVIPEVKH
jgi:hypothetical protein